jgi:hypothetical protein
MDLVWPGREYLSSYLEALRKGWSPDNVRGKAAADEQLGMIASDSDAFLASLVDREARGRPIDLKQHGGMPALRYRIALR